MKTTIAPARVVFAAGILALGLQNLLTGNFMMELQPVPAWVPMRTLLAYLAGSVAVAAAVCIVLGKSVRLAAAALLCLLLSFVLLLHVPRLVANISNGGAWTGALEIFAMAAAACLLATQSPPSQRRWIDFVDGTAGIARFCFAVTLPAFGVLHFIYRDYVASVIPAWIPAHMFWAYATGVAHIAAGFAIMTNIQARLAATLLTIMFGSWVILLHIPRAAAALDRRPEWTSLFVAITLCGGAWLIAESLARARRGADATLGASPAPADL